jgi:hypothetical protein
VRKFALFIPLAAWVLCTATVIPPVSFEDLVWKSDQIVTGQVIRSWASWGPEHKLIWTRYEIRVEDTIKGAREQTLVVSEPGGQLDGLGMRVEGAVPYESGEHVTLFLQTYPSGDKRTVGWGQGKFTLDAQGKVHPGISDGSLKGITSVELRHRIQAAATRRQIP